MPRKARKYSQFDWHAALTRADAILSAPPARAFIERPARLPTLVFRAAIEARLCLEANKLATGRMQRNSWRLAEIKRDLWTQLSIQAYAWLKYREYWPFEPIDGVRPQVIATKFSARPPDVGANPAKAAIDMLQIQSPLRTERRIGIIRRDAPNSVQQVHGWEFQPMAFPAFVLLEVRV